MAVKYNKINLENKGHNNLRKLRLIKKGKQKTFSFNTQEEFNDFKKRLLETLEVYEREGKGEEYQIFEEELPEDIQPTA